MTAIHGGHSEIKQENNPAGNAMQRLLILLVVPALALAANARADFYSHRYLGLSLGNAELAGFCDGGVSFVDRNNNLSGLGCSEEGEGLKIYGGWRWKPHLALEASYHRLPKSRLDLLWQPGFSQHLVVNEGIRTQMASAFAVGHLPLVQGLSLFGKLGGGFWMSSLRSRQSGELLFVFLDEEGEEFAQLVPVSGKSTRAANGFHWGYGAGISYRRHNNWTVRAEWEVFPDVGSSDLYGSFDVHSASLGWSMHF